MYDNMLPEHLAKKEILYDIIVTHKVEIKMV